MKIILKNQKVNFIPQHDKDCFDLGCFSTKVAHKLEMISNTDKPLPKIVRMEISTNELWKFIKEK
jgi:hypothetical protein